MKCPRRTEVGNYQPTGEDCWIGDDTCSYCGSLKPDTLMARIERGDVELGPTDKSYKVYVRNVGGDKFKFWHARKCPDVMVCAYATCDHWTKDERNDSKFYFQHLSVEQRARFIELHNDKKMKIGYPGNFYSLPFFCRKES